MYPSPAAGDLCLCIPHAAGDLYLCIPLMLLLVSHVSLMLLKISAVCAVQPVFLGRSAKDQGFYGIFWGRQTNLFNIVNN